MTEQELMKEVELRHQQYQMGAITLDELIIALVMLNNSEEFYQR